MSTYIVISGVTDNEPVYSVQGDADSKEFHVVIGSGGTSVELFRLASDGRMIDSVSIVSEGVTYELKTVYVTSVQLGSGEPPTVMVSLTADEVAYR